eukprot:gi/632974999/ref/XP_007903984.1/ PREDICTED: ubiquitin carboxyl-terminal hydrolase 31 isoform X1 [Callorhinchus milii]
MSNMSKSAAKEKKSFSKKLFRRGSVRSVGSFMSRVLKTLSTLSHFGTEEASAEDEKDDGGFKDFRAAGSEMGVGAGAGVLSSASIIMMMSGISPGMGAAHAVASAGRCAAGHSDSSDSCFSPASGDRWQPPGLAGLKNHGNTCFMNAVLQCLSNTELFAEFLALEQYRDRVRDTEGNRGEQEEETEEGTEEKGKSQSPKSNGVLFPPKSQQEKGEVTEQLATLVRALWTSQYTPQQSREFKNVVAKNAFQYRGNSQHDAQEFLLWLLDRVHEDLHQIVLTNGRPPAKPPGAEDELCEGPSPSLRSSFVQELFQAQYRSSLTCPHCQKQSNTFDPFLCISLPIPLLQSRPLNITVVYEGKCSHCMRIGVAVPLSGTVSKLREAIAQETKIPTDQIVLTEVYYDGFHRTFSDDDDLDTIHENDCIYAFETPVNYTGQRGTLTNINQNNLKFSSDHHSSSVHSHGGVKQIKRERVAVTSSGYEKLVLLVCNRCCSGQQGKRFGHPFVLCLDRKVTWEALQKDILEKMRHLFRPGMYTEVGPFSLRVVGGVMGKSYLSPQEEYPLSQATMERALKSCRPGGPQHVKVTAEWDKETKEYLFGNAEDEYVPDSETVRLQQQLHQQPQTYTLSQCFHLYTKEEQLAPDDAWRCPHCKQLQQGSIKLSLWTLPDVLIIHLKRFKQEGDKRTKLQNLVRFPLTGLDMTPHVVKRSQSSWSLPSHWSPWRRPYGLGRDPEDYLYDLYAVCNHHGTMHGGHYTAYCKNSVDGLWYAFDDSDVQHIPDEDVCKQTAYILFYQRRSAIPSWSANSSLAGSTSSSLCEHWVNRLAGSKQPSITSTASSRRTSLVSLSESVEFTQDRSDQDDGGFSTRPFVRSVQRQSLSSRSSIASPLVLSENGAKSQWPLSTKGTMRSSSPSRFSLESPAHNPTPTAGFLGYTNANIGLSALPSHLGTYAGRLKEVNQVEGLQAERMGSSSEARAPLAVMESMAREDELKVKAVSSSRPSLPIERPLDQYISGMGQPEKRNSQSETSDNNNRKSTLDLSSPQSPSLSGVSSLEDQRPRRSLLAAVQALESVQKKSFNARGVPEHPKVSLGKGHSSTSSHHPTGSPVRVSRRSNSVRDKSELKVSSRRASSSLLPKKDSIRSQDSLSSGSRPKQKAAASSHNSPSLSPSRRKPLHTQERTPGRSRTSERDSKEGRKGSPSPEKRRAAGSKSSSTARLPHAKTDSARLERRRLKNSSSSSSVAEAKSSDSNSRTDLRRDSKADDKGMSFFRSALRQKESRRSADLGKSTLVAKKSVESKKVPSEGALREGQQLSAEASSPSRSASKLATRGKASSKDPTPTKRPLLSPTKSKSVQPEAETKSPTNRKKTSDKTFKSRKIVTSGMQSSARLSKKSQ